MQGGLQPCSPQARATTACGRQCGSLVAWYLLSLLLRRQSPRSLLLLFFESGCAQNKSFIHCYLFCYCHVTQSLCMNQLCMQALHVDSKLLQLFLLIFVLITICYEFKAHLKFADAKLRNVLFLLLSKFYKHVMSHAKVPQCQLTIIASQPK